jgi:pimeloyl-ACP methyl ester carboxylesterase
VLTRSTTTTRRWRTLAAAASSALLLMAGATAMAPAAQAAEVACGNYSSSSSTCVNTQLTVGGTSYNVDWYLPNGTATALMTLQHGFSRGCGNLRGTSKAIAEKGVMVLCLNADMSGGNPALGDAFGDTLNARALTPPQGKALPQNYIVGGHSAGGHFASEVGARLNELGYPNLKGAVLFDAVASGGFSSNLQAISAGGARKVLQVAARPSLSNLTNNSFGALRDLPGEYVGIQLVWSGFFLGVPFGGSCHTDVEGENGDIIGNVAAGCTPNSTQVSRLRDFGSTWARDLATGTSTSAYYCTNENVISSCGSKVRDLVDRRLPVAATIDAS